VNDLAGMRRDYERGRLSESGVLAGWLPQLVAWFAEAQADASVAEPNAVQLATADDRGRPSVRTVLVKTIDERGIVFYTGYESAKGRDLAVNPYASAVFAWLPMERQVRLSGAVERVPRAETDTYFASRPRGSQLGAWASPQSEVVTSRSELEQRVAEGGARFGDGPVSTPPDWGGYLLRPEAVEFWQGRADRLHDRLRFRLDGPDWILERLAP
jgi:pyridoxamine 5'-phosphate oxidase